LIEVFIYDNLMLQFAAQL